MWKHLCRTQLLAQRNARTFLSDAYKCTEAWQARLDTPVLQQIKATPFYYDLEKKFQQHGQVCAVDIDIYVNKINDNTHLDELADIVHKLRLTAETSNALDSTSHAVIRHHLDFGNDDIVNLIHILDDRLSYGIFLDSYTANLALDRLLKLKNYRLAAKISSILMLQDNFDNAINRTLSLYSCYKYLEDPQPFEEPIKIDAEAEAAAAAAAAAATVSTDAKSAKARKGKKKTEEIRVRVKFLRNEFFDDHFDLRNSQHLVGKTFLSIARYSEDGAINNSIKLLGYCFYEKYDEGCKFIESLANSPNLYAEAIEITKQQLTKVSSEREKDEQYKQFVAQVDKLATLELPAQSDSLESAIKKLATDAVAKHESAEIDEQKKIYELWSQIRESKLNEELDRLSRFRRVREIERITSEMAEKEEKLWFFENEDQIDLKIQRNTSSSTQDKTYEPKKAGRQIDTSYVPPEVGAKRN